MFLTTKSKVLLTILVIAPLLATAQRKLIWIDTDMHLGRFGRDVDDGLAVMQALRSDKVAVKGISFALDIDYGYRVTQRLLNRCGQSVPIYKGARSCRALGKETDAVKALTEALKRTLIYSGTRSGYYYCFGLAASSRITATDTGGYLLWRPTTRKTLNPAKGRINLPDINFERDPVAFQQLLNANVPVVLAGYEASSTVYYDKEDIQFLRESADKTDQWLYRKLRQWQKLWRITIGSKEGFIPFDAVTAGWLTSPGYLLHYKDIPVAIERLPNDSKLFRLNNPKKPYLQVSYNYKSGNRVHYCYGVLPEFKQVMLQSLRGLSNSDTTRILAKKHE